MSLMAGFDIVVEISNETFRKMLETSLLIGGVLANPPFEVNVPISGGGVSGTAHIIVTDLQVDLNADDTVTLTLSFDRTSVATTSPLSVTVCPLDGSISITAALQLNQNQLLSVDLGAATVAPVKWSVAANQEIAKDLAGTGITPATFNTFANQALTSFVHGIAAPPIPLGLPVVAGTNGSLLPPLQLERLEVHCIFNPDRSKQALGMFGILLAANDSNGDHNQKTSTAITASNDGVCISIAPGAFHSLLFCISIANALGLGNNTGPLPKTCGSSSGFKFQGVTIKNIADSFADPTPTLPNGHIDIKGSVAKSGTCYDAKGTFHGTITLSITGTTLTPDVNMDKPKMDVSVPWYCYFAAAAVLGPIGIVLVAMLDDVADKIATILANQALDAFESSISGMTIGGVGPMSFSSVRITTEGLTLQGTLPISLPATATSQLNLNGSVVTTHSEEINSGVYQTAICAEIGTKDYHYTELSQQQTGIYQPTATLITQPFTPHYAVSGDNGIHWQSLTGASGTIVLNKVTTYYPTPQGGTSMEQSHRIAYSISATGIELSNDPVDGDYAKDGNYGFRLGVTATDCNGKPVQDGAGKPLSDDVLVNFEGHIVDLSADNYFQDFVFCKNQQTKPPPGPPQPGPYPAGLPVDEERLITYIRYVLALGLPETDEILRVSQIAYGNIFLRAIESSAARQSSLLKTRRRLGASRQQVRSIAHELMNLGQRLLNAETMTQSTDIARSIAGNQIEADEPQ